MSVIWVRGAMPKSYAELGKTLRAARLKKGLRQSDVADRSDGRLRQDYISRIESGDHRPEFDKLEAFAETLELDLNNLKILAGYPVVHEAAFDLRLGIDLGTRVHIEVEKPRAYREQLAAQTIDELAPEDWEVIEAMLERRKQERQRKE